MGTILIVFTTTVVGGVVIYGTVYILKAYVFQPRLRIRCLRGTDSSRESRPDYLELTWEQPLEIYNSTAFPALDVSFSWPDPNTELPLQPLEPPHVNGMESRTIDCKIVKEFPHEEVVAHHYRREDLRPPELRSFVLILRYKNDKGIFHFYTRFEKNGNTEVCTFHRRRPRG